MFLYFSAAFFAFFLSFFLAWAVKKAAVKFNITDKPDKERKLHAVPVPLLGGLAIFLSFFLILFFFKEKLISGELYYSHWLWFFAGGLILMIGGFIDDKLNLKPRWQIIFPILAVICVLLGDIGIKKATNPLGGLFYFSDILSELFTVAWLMLMMYTTKLLDGLDGLVSGLAAIGGLVIFLFTATTKYFQPDIALASLVFAGACLGFLVWNWNPAKIFLGEGGSLFLGYVLGVLSIISGGKIAIAVLILGLPLLDLFWTVLRRLIRGKSPFSSDRLHLHHRLLDLGFGYKKTILLFYSFSLIFGLAALFLQSRGKFIAVSFLILIMAIFIIALSLVDKKRIKELKG
jgi:UDP-GlcNAc:undecaprenyl-phosphate/decaprenyl-phosphate GlcNAc-1-phosphate transferase